MLKHIINFSLAYLLAFGGLYAYPGPVIREKMYIDDEEFQANTKGDSFHIHVGNNVWLVTNTIHRDSTGMFAYESTLSRSMISGSMEYEKKWRCPYCYQYWPIGKPCDNKECPSRYKQGIWFFLSRKVH